MVMVMAIPPSLKRKMNIHPEQTPHNFIESYTLEKAQMGHIMELDKHPDNDQGIKKPSQ